jgi:hypothetical protein
MLCPATRNADCKVFDLIIVEDAGSSPAVACRDVDLKEQEIRAERPRDDGMARLVNHERAILGVEVSFEQFAVALVVFVFGSP